jgi:hypothetical protein
MSKLQFIQYRREDQLNDSIVALHNIARIVEREVGLGNLSRDIRNCADRLNNMIKEKVKLDEH